MAPGRGHIDTFLVGRGFHSKILFFKIVMSWRVGVEKAFGIILINLFSE